MCAEVRGSEAARATKRTGIIVYVRGILDVENRGGIVVRPRTPLERKRRLRS